MPSVASRTILRGAPRMSASRTRIARPRVTGGRLEFAWAARNAQPITELCWRPILTKSSRARRNRGAHTVVVQSSRNTLELEAGANSVRRAIAIMMCTCSLCLPLRHCTFSVPGALAIMVSPSCLDFPLDATALLVAGTDAVVGRACGALLVLIRGAHSVRPACAVISGRWGLCFELSGGALCRRLA